MEKILKTYLKRLTNLSSSNKSIVLKKLLTEQFLDIHETDFLLGNPSFHNITQLLRQKERIPLCDYLDPRFEKSNLVSKKLRKIARTDQFITEERGTNDLYIGYPFVRGQFADGSPVHAPLLFFPVQLLIDKDKWCISARKDVGISLNQSFALAYAQFNQVTVTDDILDKAFDEFSTDALAFRTQLYEWLKETPFKINFNQDLFQDQLQYYAEHSITALQESEQVGELKLYPEAVLGIFPQSGSFLVPDYLQMLQILQSDGRLLLSAIRKDETAEQLPRRIKEEHLLQVFPSDSSQEQVLRLAKQGQSLVVQGPPGTGKSQLICNLMTDFAAEGKKVLLVCQKRAALDVVYKRLQTIGLEKFLGLVHDFKNDRAVLYQQIHQQIESVDEYIALNNSLDAVVIEREFTQNSRHTDKIIEQLEEFKTALYQENICGISVKQLYLTSSQERAFIPLDDLYVHFRFDEGHDFMRRLRSYATYLTLFANDHSWADRKNFAAFTRTDLHAMQQSLLHWSKQVQIQADVFSNLLATPFSFAYLSMRRTTVHLLATIINQLPISIDLLQKLSKKDQTTVVTQKSLLMSSIEKINGLPFWESTLSLTDALVTQEILRKGIVAKNGLMGIKWAFFPAEDKKTLQELCTANHVSYNPDGFQTLQEGLQTKINIGHKLSFLDSLSHATTKEEYLTATHQYIITLECIELLGQLPPLWNALLLQQLDQHQSIATFQKLIEQIQHWLISWEEPLKNIHTYFTDFQIQALYKEPQEHAAVLLRDLNDHFDNLVEADQLWYTMSSVEKEVVNRILELEPNITSSLATSIFDNSLRLAWIEHIENQNPILRAVSSQKMVQWEEYLQENIATNQKLSQEIALIRLREDTYQQIESNRLGNRLTYRELAHQVTKKRKVWPIRKLIEKYHEEILRLIPCWMASPESVSAIFPLEAQLFDIVIFDEASQCYSEYGLPAIYRGKQIIITGDSKQLPPTNLYKVRYEEVEDIEGENLIATEAESLLDLASQYLPSQPLMGHYRSKSLELIDFSNQHFYQGRLQLLPDFVYLNQQVPAISYLKTEGIWENNRNEVEAQAIVDLVKTLRDTKKSIGIVTFNYFQQQLIQDLLEQSKLILPDLFVKNIENVQGDERDIIIFSLGYAPNVRGKMTMQFGLLNMPGGENRLNVAITRAKEHIYLVTSILPSQLTIENATHEGPKLLKAYLEYAKEVSEGNFVPFNRKNHTAKASLQLKAKLAEENTNLQTLFPFADLTVRKDNLFTGLILTDDDLYYQSITTKEPHANLPLLLLQKRWPYERFYSRQYWLGERVKN